MQRLPRFVELLLIVALVALVAFWATRLLRGTPIAVPALVTNDTGNGGDRVDGVIASARLFGSRRPGVLSDNVRPLGVVADEAGRGSVIVSIDGQPPKVYRVGDTLDGRLVSAIRSDEIELESGGARQTFRLPPPQTSATGVTVFGTGPAPTGLAQPPQMQPQMQPQQGPSRSPQPPPEGRVPFMMPPVQTELQPPPAAEPGH